MDYPWRQHDYYLLIFAIISWKYSIPLEKYFFKWGTVNIFISFSPEIAYSIWVKGLIRKFSNAGYEEQLVNWFSMLLKHFSSYDSTDYIFCFECLVQIPFLFFAMLLDPSSWWNRSIFSVTSLSCFVSLSSAGFCQCETNGIPSVLQLLFKYHWACIA